MEHKPVRQIPPPRDYHMRIARDGTWYHEGAPIRRLALARLFASVLKRLDDGTYWLETPAERGVIAVEDAPFVAVELVSCAAGASRLPDRLDFRTNLDQVVSAGPARPIVMRTSPVTGQPTPYLLMERGLSARLGTGLYYQLAALAETRVIDGVARLAVSSDGAFFALDEPADEDKAGDGSKNSQ